MPIALFTALTQSLCPLALGRVRGSRTAGVAVSLLNLARNLLLGAVLAIGAFVAPLAQAATPPAHEIHPAQVSCEGMEAAENYVLASGLFNSFPADTLVHTRIQTDAGYQTQLKRIADIQVGDEVLALDELAAYDLQTQAKQAASPIKASASSSQINSSLSDAGEIKPQGYQKVTQLLNTPERIRTLVHLTLDNGETLTATDGHPLKTDEGWRDAVLLKKGGKLLLKGGDEDSAQPRYTTITDVRIEQELITTYNLEVAQLHTYLVGMDGVVVHNGTYDDRPGGFRPGVWDAVWDVAVEATTGRVRDPQSGRFMSKCKPWDMGHKPGNEWRRHKKDLKKRGANRETVLDEHNDPNKYRPELPSSNRNHKSEEHSPF